MRDSSFRETFQKALEKTEKEEIDILALFVASKVDELKIKYGTVTVGEINELKLTFDPFQNPFSQSFRSKNRRFIKSFIKAHNLAVDNFINEIPLR